MRQVHFALACLSVTLLLSNFGCGGEDSTGGAGTVNLVPINDCDPATAEDHTAQAAVTITNVGVTYAPACVLVAAGTEVTFSMDLTSHPLVGGEIRTGTKIPDTSSPIPATNMGMEAKATLNTPGGYGFYCDMHGLSGMKGAIYVE